MGLARTRVLFGKLSGACLPPSTKSQHHTGQQLGQRQLEAALDTGPLDTVGKTSVSMETWLETALWKPALSLVTKLVTSVLVTPGFSASSLCAPAPSSRVRARRLTLRKIGRKFGRCLRANQVANQPAQTADSVRTGLRTNSMRTGSKVRFRCYSGCYSHCYALSAKCGFSVNRPVNHPEKYGFAC